MEKKEKRYGIQSNVHVPNMQDIQKAASDYFEEAGTNDPRHDFVSRNAKHFLSPEKDNKYDPLLSNIKKEMLQLGKVIATEEVAAEGLVTGESPETGDIEDIAEPAEPDEAAN